MWYTPLVEEITDEKPLMTKEIFELVQWMLDPKAIDGAIKSAVHAHGPIAMSAGNKMKVISSTGEVEEIGTCGTFSAAKRIRGAMKTRAVEYLRQKRAEALESEAVEKNSG